PSPILAGPRRSRAMRTFSLIAAAAVVLAGGTAPVRSFDGSPSPNTLTPQAAVGAPPMAPATTPLAPAAVAPASPGEAYRSANEALKSGEKARAVISLQYAAEHGHGVALWQLGRMYADGDGVKRDDYRAF